MGGSGASLGRNSSSSGGASSIDRAAFTDEGFGQWSIDTGYGGGTILREQLSTGEEYYSVKVWDSNYETLLEQSASTLNRAKRLVKDTLKEEV